MLKFSEVPSMFSVRRLAMAGLVALAAVGSLTGQAQQVYRIVGPDGKVTFSDRPPPDGKGTPANSLRVGASSTASLPFELRGVVQKYPVTLYSGPDCGPCVTGRQLLISRGVPYTERTVTSEDDIEALKRLAGAARLPFLTIGGQQLRGFSEIEWGQFLDAAGYPKTSQLPAGFRNPPPAPLVAVAKPAEAPAAQAPAAAPESSSNLPPLAPAPSGGIRF
jgi:glutaredoxin